MVASIITGATRAAQALREVPEAPGVFARYGFDPRLTCGALTQHMHLRDVGRDCGFQDVDGLIELRAVER
jgi:hypothetical protein